MQPKALALRGDVSSRGKRIVQKLEVWFLKERFSWADGVGRIGDDNVVCGFVVRQELEAVADEDGHFWGSEEGRHVWEVLLRHSYHGLEEKNVVSNYDEADRDQQPTSSISHRTTC